MIKSYMTNASTNIKKEKESIYQRDAFYMIVDVVIIDLR